ncbi:MAG TPA: phospholipid carrier-dependent glycosyltransferase, partial [Syntrophales bacterium]|nr:phospholipid carrier-dependent glycosyltransferase [Syntrophales bacterium]
MVKKFVLLLIITTGLFLRVAGADWGFPFLVHPDESVVAEIPIQMVERSTLDPGEYSHPDHFDIYANALLYLAASHLVYHKPLAETFENHKLLFYHTSRIFVAILGIACIIAAFFIGEEYGGNTGLIAAMLVAIFPSYVTHSHFITADIPLTLFVLSVILFTVRYLKNASNKDLLTASFFSALAVSVKYPGVLTLLLILSAIVCKNYRNKKVLFVKSLKAITTFVFILFISSPYLFINWFRVIQALYVNATPVHLGADGLDWHGTMLFYAKNYFDFSGCLVTIFFGLGTFYIIKIEKMLAIPMFFGLFYWIVLSKLGLHWERWALPMYTCPLLVSAYGINYAYEKSL